MKRLAAVLAATVFATGCWIDDDDCTGTVTVDWPDFLMANGAVTPNCGTAGIDGIDIYLDGVPVDRRFACEDDGATIVGVRRGDFLFTVEGIDVDGNIRYRDEFTVAASCGDRFVSAQPAAGTANLDYQALGGCGDPGGCFLWFSVFDVVANTVTFSRTKATDPAFQTDFPYPEDVEFDLPAGPHRVEWMELVAASDFAPEASRCTPVDFDVARGSTPAAPSFTPVIDLVDGGPACH